MVPHGSMQCGALLQPRHPYSVDDYRPGAAAGRSQPQDPHPLPGLRLIQLEGHRLVLHAVLGDDADLHRVALQRADRIITQAAAAGSGIGFMHVAQVLGRYCIVQHNGKVQSHE